VEVYSPVTPPEDFANTAFGLFSAINWVPDADPHWQGGIQYDAECTAVGVTSSPCISGSPDSAELLKTATWTRSTRGARPFTAYDEVDCSAAGGGWEEGQNRALAALARSAQTQVEATFWSGSSGLGAPVFPNLTTTGVVLDSTRQIVLQPASTIISGAPLDVVEGLGRLEQALRDCYDGVGVIHVPLRLASAFAARNLCYIRGNQLVTYAGNIVVIGGGYPGTGPDGSTPPGGSMWIRATGPLFGYRSAPRTFDPPTMLDRSVNTFKAIAEQNFLVGWRCCLVGALVTTGGEQAGEPNAATQDT